MGKRVKTHEELAKDVDGFAEKIEANYRWPEAAIVRSSAKLIHSNARNEAAVKKLTSTVQEFNTKAERQTRQLLLLTWVIATLTLAIAVLTILILLRE